MRWGPAGLDTMKVVSAVKDEARQRLSGLEKSAASGLPLREVEKKQVDTEGDKGKRREQPADDGSDLKRREETRGIRSGGAGQSQSAVRS